jgi:hypothetical protein
MIIQVFDPPMCCSTGVCGPAVDPELVRFAADLQWLQSQRVEVVRYNLSQQPAAFVSTPAVKAALAKAGNRYARPRGMAGGPLMHNRYTINRSDTACAVVMVSKDPSPTGAGRSR